MEALGAGRVLRFARQRRGVGGRPRGAVRASPAAGRVSGGRVQAAKRSEEPAESPALARRRAAPTGYGEGPDGDLPPLPGLPSQAQTLTRGTALKEPEDRREPPDLDYLSELIAIQQDGPRDIGFFGTRNMGFLHQQLIEIVSYALVVTKNHIFTSGATGTNAAVIRGALRAGDPELLTVVLPQSLSKQPPESQEMLKEVQNVIETPSNDHLPLLEASRICNETIVSKVQQVICFAFHDSSLLLETCERAKESRKMVTLFFLD